MEKETLEEFIDRVDTPVDFDQFSFDEGIRLGAKWQAERMYSEEEIREVIRLAQFNDNGAIIPMTEEEIILQFKKK